MKSHMNYSVRKGIDIIGGNENEVTEDEVTTEVLTGIVEVSKSVRYSCAA